jgi:uncharacterized protein YegJ (DUF2314 family)
MRLLVSLLFAITLLAPLAAQAARTRTEVPAGPLVEQQVLMLYGVYVLQPPKEDPIPGLIALQQERFGFLSPSRGFPEGAVAGPGVFYDVPPIEDMAPPSAGLLVHFGRGLSPAELAWLPGARYAIVFGFHCDVADADQVRRAAGDLVAEFAAKLGGIVWDEETREAFGAKAWRASRGSDPAGPPDAMGHVTLHSYRDGDLLRIVSLGMARFGLPDLAVYDVPATSTAMPSLVNLVAQSLMEGVEVAEGSVLPVSIAALRNEPARAYQSAGLMKGGTGKATVTLRFIEPEQGDAANRLMELVFEAPGKAAQVVQDEVLTQLYGGNDEVTHVDHDAELMAASRRAHERLMKLKPSILDGLEPNEALLVKAPFTTTSGGNEWMWVEVVRWEGATIRGILQNDPFEVPSLKAGATVEVTEDTLFDYLHYKPDGTTAGNETGEIMQRRQR